MSGGPKNARVVYLVTYSQAEKAKVGNRERFSEIVLEAFNETGSVNNFVIQWVCCEEKHKDGNTHFHMAVKLNLQRRWLSVRNFLENRYGVKVNFSDNHSSYYDAWVYCKKDDEEVLSSSNHPDLTTMPRTVAASSQRHRNSLEKLT